MKMASAKTYPQPGKRTVTTNRAPQSVTKITSPKFTTRTTGKNKKTAYQV